MTTIKAKAKPAAPVETDLMHIRTAGDAEFDEIWRQWLGLKAAETPSRKDLAQLAFQAGVTAQVRIHVASAGRNAVVEVTDRGPGIPDAVITQLFRPFYTTSEHGTGLGLYIARELCHANGARLDYLPRGAATGSCFRITLPAANALLQN